MVIQPKNSARLILASIIVGFLIGDLIFIDQSRVWPITIGVVLSLLVVAFTFNKEKWVVLACILSFFLISSIIYTGYRNANLRPNAEFKNNSQITGIISGRPALTDKQQIVLQIESGYKILVNLPRFPEYKYGQKLTVTGKLEDPAIFPDFNYRNYLKGKQIYLVINRAEKVEDHGFAGSRYKRVLYQIADKFEVALNRSYPEPAAAFSAGLLLGSKRGLPDDLVDNMQITGTSHLVAISGYNITIIAAVLSLLMLPLGRRFGFSLVALIILSFVILTGASASVTRGAIMAILILLAEVLDRRADQTNILLLAATLLCLLNPLELIYDTGFQLSFVAFAGLIYIGPSLRKLLEKHKKIPEVVKGTLAETLAAQIATLPILLFSVGKFSLIAPLPNILILPLVPLAMLLSLLTGLAGMATASLGTLVGSITWVFIEYPLRIIDWFAKVPLASYDVKTGNFWLAIGLYAGIIVVTLRFKRSKYVKVH